MARGKPFGALGRDRLVTHNLIVAGGTVAAGSLGFAFAAVISHHLTPGDFGSVFAVNTLLTLIWLPATAFGVVMARQATRDRARGDAALSTALLFLIARFHQSILQVVQVLDVCMAALLVGLILPFVARRRSEQPTGGKALAPTPS